MSYPDSFRHKMFKVLDEVGGLTRPRRLERGQHSRVIYGSDLPDDLHRQLRGRVPSESLAWVERETNQSVVNEHPLEGGTSAAIHRLLLADGQQVVLQRFVLGWIAEEPWVPANEVRVLGLLTASAVPAPRVLTSDPNGTETGQPAVLMTSLPGDVVWNPVDGDPWLDGLLEIMTTIHQVPLADGLRGWEPYPPERVPPAWTQHPWAWERAIAAYHSPRPASNTVLLHRDFHPGNVLWTDGRVSGVVDWVSSCAGPPEEDVSHCRVNLASRHGQAVADRFLDNWMRATGHITYDPYWDLVNAVSMGGSPPNPRLDEFVAAAARRSGPFTSGH